MLCCTFWQHILYELMMMMMVVITVRNINNNHKKIQLMLLTHFPCPKGGQAPKLQKEENWKTG